MISLTSINAVCSSSKRLQKSKLLEKGRWGGCASPRSPLNPPLSLSKFYKLYLIMLLFFGNLRLGILTVVFSGGMGKWGGAQISAK